MAPSAKDPAKADRVTLKEVREVLDALYRSGRPLSCPLRFGARQTVGMLADRLPDEVALTIALRETFSACTPSDHLRASVESAERYERETIEHLRDYLRYTYSFTQENTNSTSPTDDRPRLCTGAFRPRRLCTKRYKIG